MLERLDARRSLLLVVDVQERLAAAMPEDAMARLLANAAILLESAKILGVPVVCTEQYPKGLGPTVAPLLEKLSAGGVTPIDKMTFDAMSEPRAAAAVAAHDPTNVIVLGMESHVCVFQSVRELRRRRLRTIVVSDAVTSRTEINRQAGLALAERCGATAIPTESIVFDWLERAGTDQFKAISKLVR